MRCQFEEKMHASTVKLIEFQVQFSVFILIYICIYINDDNDHYY